MIMLNRKLSSDVQITSVKSSNESSGVIPSDILLKQNYPNPFNPVTSISFYLAKENYAVLKIYSILGKEIITLINRKLSAGVHTATFDASNLSSGIYFYELISGGSRIIKKMVLLK
jgi:hypothetical protein